MNSRPETALGIGGRRPREESEIHPNYKSAPENGEHRNGWTCFTIQNILSCNQQEGQSTGDRRGGRGATGLALMKQIRWQKKGLTCGCGMIAEGSVRCGAIQRKGAWHFCIAIWVCGGIYIEKTKTGRSGWVRTILRCLTEPRRQVLTVSCIRVLCSGKGVVSWDKCGCH